MPKSKRDKKISLTKTERKGLQWKQKMIEDIRVCVKKYPNIYLFSVENMRNNLLKDLRSEWKKDSRFIFGKNRIMQIGLGRTKDDEQGSELHKLSARLHGQCGLLFTEKSKEKVLEWSDNYSALEYARSGCHATETVILPEGPLEDFSHAIEPHLRALGLPTKLHKGIVQLYKEYTVCEEGNILTPEQARILKLIARPMAKFSLKIKCYWSKNTGYESIIDDEDTENIDAECPNLIPINSNNITENEDEDEDDEMDED